MDPELQRALELVRAAREQGRSDRAINSALRRSGLPVNSIRQLEAEAGFQARQSGGEIPEAPVAAADAVRVGNDPVPQPEPLPLRERARAQLTNVANAFFGGLGDDVAGLFSRDAQENINEQVDIAREQDPLLSLGAELGTLAFGPTGRLGARAITRAGSRGGDIGARVGSGVARRLGGGELMQLMGSGVGRTLGTGTGAGSAGAVEGGLIGFGETRPGEDRAAGTGLGAGLGFVVPGGVGLLGGARNAARRVSRIQHEGGEHLADALTESGGLLGTQSVTQARGRLRGMAAEAFEEADADLFPPAFLLRRQDDGAQIVDPAVRRVLRGSGTDEATSLLSRLEAYATGESIEPITGRQASAVKRQVKAQADEFARGVPNPDVFRVDEAQRALNLIDEGMESIPAFSQANRLTARHNRIERAVDAGNQLRGATAEEVEAALRGQKVKLPGASDPIHLRTADEVIAAQEAFARPMVAKLRGGADDVKGFLNEVFNSSETRRKLQLVFGDDSAAWENFLREARQVRALNDANKFQQFGVKYASFMLLGSSILGDPLTGLLGIGD